MDWRFIVLYSLSLLLTSCTTYGTVAERFSRAVDPTTYATHDRNVACQQQGKLTCGQ